MSKNKLTKNFSFNEFKPRLSPSTWAPHGVYQNLLITLLANNLQVVRDAVKKPMIVTSGVRTMMDFDRLTKQGLRPCPTSDHFFGVAVPVSRKSTRYQKFGETYNFAVGAADIVPRNMTARELFDVAVDLTCRKKCYFSQIIYEENPRTGAKWVHFANPHEPLFSHNIITFLNRQKYMQSLDGGKTFTIVEP